MKLTNEIKTKLADLLEQRDVFKDTNIEQSDVDEDDHYLTYHAMRIFNTIIVQEEWMSLHDNSTEYLIFENGLVRDSTSEEEILRTADQNDYPFREYDDAEYIISKTVGNKINRFDGPTKKQYESLSLKDDDLLLMEFRQQNWDTWVEFCHARGYDAEVSEEDKI